MNWKKRLGVVAGVALGVFLALVAMVFYLLRASVFVPPPGEVRLAGLSQPATVHFDAWGVPHVEAKSARDAWFLQGYLHARERFFQMELSRRAASGRLAELLGDKALAVDVRFRRWGLAEAASLQRQMLPPEAEEVLAAYAAGVNAAFLALPAWRLSPECVLLGCQPEPWRVEDTLGVGLLLQYTLTWAAGEELQRLEELRAFGRDKAVNLWGWRGEEADLWIPPQTPQRPAKAPAEPPPPVFSGVGSNSWVVAASLSATGMPLLANDPHVGVANPATWYEVHLQAPGLALAGVSVPGTPGVLIGHNQHLAWGLTMVMLDDQDLFLLKLDEGGTHEFFGDRWLPLGLQKQSFKVRGASKPQEVVLKRSLHGPVVREENGQAYALAWTALRARSPVECFLRLARAEDVFSGMTSFATCESPAMNLLLADRHGNIAWQVTGRVPKRGKGAGKLPAPGDDPSWAWQGFAPYEHNPRVVNPSAGFLATANHDPFAEGDFPGEPFPGEFAPPYRVRTIKKALTARKSWDVEGFLQLQMDEVNPQALELLAALRPFLLQLSHAEARALLRWDGKMHAESQTALLWANFLRALVRQVGVDEAKASSLSRSPFTGEVLLRLLSGALDPQWWDDVSTPAVETAADVIRKAFEEAVALSRGKTWGQEHRLLFAHALGEVPVLGTFFNVGPVGVGGAAPCLNATAYRAQGRDFAVVSLPSTRFVADLRRWDNSRLVLPLGQSGHPLSSHAKDQLPQWLAGHAHTMPFTPEAVARAAVRTTHFVP